MFNDLSYAYIVGDFILLSLWLIFFFWRKDLRKEMLIISLFSAPLGATQYFFGQDYWQPAYILGNSILGFGLEDIVYMFATGGILGVIYEEFFGKKLSKRHTRRHPYIMFALSALGLLTLFVGTAVFHINSIYVSSIIFLCIGVITITIRHDLLKHALYSGLCLGLLTLSVEIFYVFLFPDVFQSWWVLDNISGIFLLSVPLEELIFAFTLGFVGGPMYEFVFGLKLKNKI